MENLNMNESIIGRSSSVNSKASLTKRNSLLSYLGENKTLQIFTAPFKIKQFSTREHFDLLELENHNEEEEEEVDEVGVLDSSNLRSLIKIIVKNYEEDKKMEEKQQRITVIREKIWVLVRKIKEAKLLGKEIKVTLQIISSPTCYSKIVMHPELSTVRFFIDFIICILLSVDLIMTPFEYLVSDPQFDNNLRDMFFDVFFFMDIVSNFFTAFLRNRLLISDFKSIALNYLKLNFILDLSYVFPFWLINTSLIHMRFIKVYKFPYLMAKARVVITAMFSCCIKSIKLLSSSASIIIFLLNLFYIIHISACLYVCIGRNGPDQNWLVMGHLDNASEWEKYMASVYVLLETFTTIGYGDLVPVTIPEILFIMVCEIINVGLFAYFISCILDILANLQTDEISFKFHRDIDIEKWVINYNQIIPENMKVKMLKEEEPIFDSIKKYFDMFHKMECSWIKKFDFLRQMRPRERNQILEYTFSSLFNTFESFFSGLEPYFKIQIALNIKTKFLEKDEKSKIIISEIDEDQINSTNKKKQIRYFYFIAKGKVGVFKNNIEISRFHPGSYFGDEYLLNKRPQFTYKCLDSSVYLFCVPVTLIDKLCSYDEQSYLFLLYKSLLRMNKIKYLYHLINFKHQTEINNNKRHYSNSITVNNRLMNLNMSENELEDSEFNLRLLKKKSTFMRSSSNAEKFFGKEQAIVNSIAVTQSIEESDSETNKASSHTESHLKEENTASFADSVESNDEFTELFTDETFFDKIEVNVDNMGDMKKLTKQKEKYMQCLKYVNSLGKKYNFLKSQLDMIKVNFGKFKDKSSDTAGMVKESEKFKKKCNSIQEKLEDL